MAVRAYILLETDIGKARAVVLAVSQLSLTGCRVVQADTVTGPYDAILHLEADDLGQMSKCVLEAIQGVAGVQRTTTCLAIRLA